jgi:hypothetical protein
VRGGGGVLALLLLTPVACAPDVTSPEGAAAVGRVVPIAVPDVWCPANRAPEDTLQVNNLPACHTTVAAPPPASAPQDSTSWQKMKLAPLLTRDSIPPESDTAR